MGTNAIGCSSRFSVGGPCSPVLCSRAVPVLYVPALTSPCGGFGCLRGQPFVQQAGGFLAPQLFPDSSQPAVSRQTRTQRLDGFPGLQCSLLQLVVQFFA